MSRRSAVFVPVVCSVVLVLGAAGCRSAAGWRADADRAAAERLAAARAAEGLPEERLEIESPSDSLRRRLFVGQGLPVFDPASLGIRDLPTNRYWRAEDRLLPGREGADAAFAPAGTNALEIGLQDAVRIAAANSPEFRSAKESLFASALALDLASREFHTTLLGALSAAVSSTPGAKGSPRDADGEAATAGAKGSSREVSHGETATAGAKRTFENGVSTDASLALNLAGMLTGERKTAWGAVADLSVSIPLLRGSGSLVRRESLTQAERDLVYAVRDFEQRKRALVADVARAYLSLLLALRTRQNEDENLRRVEHSTRRSRRMADASRMSKTAFDQSYQSELAARAGWIAACQNYEGSLDSFKAKIGLPPDARIRPRESDLEGLRTLVAGFLGTAEEDDAVGANGGSEAPRAPDSVDEGALKEATDRALAVAFERRTDVLSARDRVEDAQRHLLVAEDALRSEVTLGGAARVGESATPSMGAEGRDHGEFRMKDGTATGTLKVDLALERTEERNAYRNALIALEAAVRDWQKAEDGLKAAVREDMRALSQTREQLRIQSRAVELAARRVRNQDLLLEAGRADMTDLLDAQAALLAAQNSLDRAITDHRVQELSLRRDIGALDATVDGIWTESDPTSTGFAAVPVRAPSEPSR